jgi:hypothetical protein
LGVQESFASSLALAHLHYRASDPIAALLLLIGRSELFADRLRHVNLVGELLGVRNSLEKTRLSL